MRGVIMVFLFLIAVIWDLAQNNGHWIRFVAFQVAQTLHMIGIF